MDSACTPSLFTCLCLLSCAHCGSSKSGALLSMLGGHVCQLLVNFYLKILPIFAATSNSRWSLENEVSLCELITLFPELFFQRWGLTRSCCQNSPGKCRSVLSRVPTSEGTRRCLAFSFLVSVQYKVPPTFDFPSSFQLFCVKGGEKYGESPTQFTHLLQNQLTLETGLYLGFWNQRVVLWPLSLFPWAVLVQCNPASLLCPGVCRECAQHQAPISASPSESVLQSWILASSFCLRRGWYFYF